MAGINIYSGGGRNFSDKFDCGGWGGGILWSAILAFCPAKKGKKARNRDLSRAGSYYILCRNDFSGAAHGGCCGNLWDNVNYKSNLGVVATLAKQKASGEG